jgi:hypothetical protein
MRREGIEMSGYCKIGFRANKSNECIFYDKQCIKSKCNYWIELDHYIKNNRLKITDKDLEKLDK